MSLLNPLGRRASHRITYDLHLEYLYDKYGDAVYGIILKAVNEDDDLAGKCMQQVFNEIYLQKNNFIASNRTFIKMMQATAKVLHAQGYKVTSRLNAVIDTGDISSGLISSPAISN